MNISAWTIYWFIKLDSIISLCGGFAFFTIMLFLLVLVGVMVCYGTRSGHMGGYCRNEEKAELWYGYAKYWTKMAKRIVILPILFIILHNMIPSTKEMATIYVIPKIANSTFVNETLPAEMKDIYGMAKDWMKTTFKTEEVKPAADKPECKNCGKEHK
jgi:hypothetical protein